MRIRWSCVSQVRSAEDLQQTRVELKAQSVADFYAAYRAALAELGVAVKIWPMPVEVAVPIRFDRDTAMREYDPRGRRTLPRGADAGGCAAEAVCDGVPGEDQPGAFLLGRYRPLLHALQRTGGERAAEGRCDAAGGLLARGDLRRLLAGEWRLRRGGVLLLRRAGPETLSAKPVHPGAWDSALGEFILKYGEVQANASPEDVVMSFLERRTRRAQMRQPGTAPPSNGRWQLRHRRSGSSPAGKVSWSRWQLFTSPKPKRRATLRV